MIHRDDIDVNNSIDIAVQLSLRVDPSRETAPFISAYLTKDVAVRQSQYAACFGSTSGVHVGGHISSNWALCSLPLTQLECASSDTFQKRLVGSAIEVTAAAAAAAAAAGSTNRGHRSATGNGVGCHVLDGKREVKLNTKFTLPLNPGVAHMVLPEDASICFHVFCDVLCDGVWGSHTCGWTNMTLQSLAHIADTQRPSENGEFIANSLLTDPGDSKPGVRGTISVSFSGRTAGLLSRSVRFNTRRAEDGSAAMRSGLNSMMGAMRKYHDESTVLYSALNPVSRAISIAVPPMYVSCGNRISRPPCAFIMSHDPPLLGQDYYLRALQCVLTRKLRFRIPDEPRSEYVKLFISIVDRVYGTGGACKYSGLLTNDELGAILMDTALWFSTSCVYLFDEAINPAGSALEDGEDFSRLVSMTMCADCEDFSYAALMALREIKECTWDHPAMHALQKIRAQYVATIAFKALSGGSFGVSTRQSSVQLEAHDNCDLVPICRLKEMLKRFAGVHKQYGPESPLARGVGNTTAAIAVITDMIEERKRMGYKIDEQHQNKELHVIVGEGTSRVSLYTNTTTDANSSVDARIVAKRLTLGTLVENEAHVPIPYDMENDGRLYRYVTWAVIGDTLDHTRRRREVTWELPHVAFVTMGQSVEPCKYGATHTKYVTCNDSVAAVPLPPPSDEEYTIMNYLEKFEHPSVPVSDPRHDLEAYDAATKRIASWAERVIKSRSPADAAAQAPSQQSQMKLTDIYLGVWSVSDAALRQLEERILNPADSLCLISFSFEHVADGVAFVVLTIGVVVEIGTGTGIRN